MTRHIALLLVALVLPSCSRSADPPPVGPQDSPQLTAAAPGLDAPAPPVSPEPGGAPDPGAVDATFTVTVPGDRDQQLPDEALGGQEVMTPEQAVALALAMLDARAQAVGDGIVLFSGMGQHGVPVEPDDPDPALLEPGEPAIVVDPGSLDPATTYADCLGILQSCAMRSTTMDGCVDAVPGCTTDQPWLRKEHCCPEGALDAYRAARTAGTPWAVAFLENVIDGIGYFPGLTDLYEEGGLR